MTINKNAQKVQMLCLLLDLWEADIAVGLPPT